MAVARLINKLRVPRRACRVGRVYRGLTVPFIRLKQVLLAQKTQGSMLALRLRGARAAQAVGMSAGRPALSVGDVELAGRRPETTLPLLPIAQVLWLATGMQKRASCRVSSVPSGL